MSSHVVSIRHELSLSVLRVIALSRITYKAMMQNLVLATACHSPYGWSLRALGNYSPDGHRCPRDDLPSLIVALNAQFLRHFRLGRY